MSNEIILGLSIGTLAGLAVTSHYFDRWVCRQHEQGEAADGETATWVAIGSGYTTIGFTVLVSLWAHRLPRDWTLGPAVGLLLLVCFVASGLPMWIGDRNRSRAIRNGRAVRRKLEGHDAD